MTGIQLIVGLGNPGSEYEKTRHNVGVWFIDALAQQYQLAFRRETKFRGAIAKLDVLESTCWLLKPSTYMNESGQSVLAFARFYKVLPNSILIVHDELDFDVGTIRIKHGGGHGGHNGLRDIFYHLKTKDFYRLRIGIGHPGSKDRVTPYVLGTPSQTDRYKIMGSIKDSLKAVPYLIAGNIDRAYQLLHS